VDAEQLRCIAKVRFLVLREIVAGGGEPRPAQVRRAFAPIATWLEPPWSAGCAPHDAVVSGAVRTRRRPRKKKRVEKSPTGEGEKK